MGLFSALQNSWDLIRHGDKRVDNWMFMSSPLPTLFMTASYLYFVKIWGPWWMKNRPAFDLRYVMIVYNFAMVIGSLIMFIEMGNLIEWGRYTFYCQSVDYSTDPIPMRMCSVGWYFLVTKYIEFIDTIFFVLRKKQNQVSTLHVFHHSVVPISVWIGLKYAPGGNNALFPVLNSGVHTVMYLYYGLAAFGPQMQKFLWWKKYLTTLQLLQFILAFAHGFKGLVQDCEFPKSFVFMNIFHAVMFFYLFSSFYRQSYSRAKASGKNALTVHTSAGPEGASTYARIGGLTITASVHYESKEEDYCRKPEGTSFSALAAHSEEKMEAKKLA